MKILDCFDAFIEYRNKLVGHGAFGTESDEHYTQFADLFLGAIVEILGRNKLDVLAGYRLVYVSRVERLGMTQWGIDRIFLQGVDPQPLLRFSFEATSSESLPLPERLYLQPPGGDDAAGLGDRGSFYPLAIFNSDNSETLLLNARTGEHKLQYLGYVTGERRNEGLIDDQRNFFSRALKVPPSSDRVESVLASCNDDTKEGGISSPADPDRQRRYLGDYELLSEVGRGGDGDRLPRMAVLSRPTGRAQSTPAKDRCYFVGTFSSRDSGVSRVDHINLVKVYAPGCEDDQYFYTMELVEGTDLGRICQLLSASGLDKASDDQAWEQALSSAVDQARRRGVVDFHRRQYESALDTSAQPDRSSSPDTSWRNRC